MQCQLLIAISATHNNWAAVDAYHKYEALFDWPNDWPISRLGDPACCTPPSPLALVPLARQLQLRLRLGLQFQLQLKLQLRRKAIVCLAIWTVSYAIVAIVVVVGVVIVVVMQMNAGFGQLTFAHASPSAPLSLTCANQKGTAKQPVVESHVARTLVATCVGFRARLRVDAVAVSPCCTVVCTSLDCLQQYSNKWVQRAACSAFQNILSARVRVRCLSLSFAFALLRWRRRRRQHVGVAHNLSTAL